MINVFKKLIDSPTILSWSSVFVRFGSALFVLPLTLKVFTPLEQSFWFLLTTVTGFAMLADSGFGSTLVRAVSYFKAGAKELPQSREDYEEKLEVTEEGPNLEKLQRLLSTSFRIYLFINLFMIFILLTAGILMVWNIMEMGHHRIDFWIAYALIILNSTMSIMGVKWSSFVRGLGYIKLESRYGLVQGLFQILVFIILLSFGLKPVYLIAYMTFQVIARYFYLKKLVVKWFSEQGIKVGHPDFDKGLFKSLWSSTWRFGGLSWGVFAVNSGTSVVISQLKDPVMMASFLLTQRIVVFISNMAKAPFYTNIPIIYELTAKKDMEGLKKKSSEYIFVGLSLLVGALGVILLFGNMGLELLGVETRFVPFWILLVIIISEILEIHSSYHAGLYISTNHIPFLWPATISGVLIIAAGFYVMPIYGVLGVVLAKLVIQLVYNYWYSVKLSLQLLNWNFFEYLAMLPVYGIKGITNKIKFLKGK